MDDNHVSDNDGNNEDDPEVADGVSLGPRLSNSQVQAFQASHPPYVPNRYHHPPKPRKCPLFVDLSVVSRQAQV